MYTADITKYFGHKIIHNENKIYAILNNHQTTPFLNGFNTNNIINFTGLETHRILITSQVNEKDIFIIKEKKYRVFSFKTVGIEKRNFSNEVMLFEDDFNHEIDFYEQEILGYGCNLPKAKERPYLTAMARISTLNSNDYLQLGAYANENTTHIFSLLYNEEIIFKQDKIKWHDKEFQINSWININEQNRLLMINTTETTPNNGVFNA